MGVLSKFRVAVFVQHLVLVYFGGKMKVLSLFLVLSVFIICSCESTTESEVQTKAQPWTGSIIKVDKEEYIASSTTIINIEVNNYFSSPFYYICSGDIFLEELQNDIVITSWKIHGFEECLAAKSINPFDNANFSISLFNEPINIGGAHLDNNHNYRLKFMLYQNKDFAQLLADDLLHSEKFHIIK